MTYDIFTYNGEFQILKLHLNVLNDYVDKFIIVEATKTFTGNDKPLHFMRNESHFKPWWKKIDYYVMDDWDDTDIWQQAIESPNTKGASHWKREYYIKESLHKAIQRLNPLDSDLMLIGDVDEIIDPTVSYESQNPFKARLRVYAGHLNNRSNEQFWGTLVAPYKDIKGKSLNQMRSDKSLYSKGDYLGWHFTNMGGVEEVRRKLNDSYTPETYNTYEVQQQLPDRIRAGEDYLGRPFKFKQDDSEWPAYLLKNKAKYQQLCL